MDIGSLCVTTLQGGLGNLAAYLAAHVLLCLLPAFFIAGAMTALIPKEAITRFLGRNTPRLVSYPAAAKAELCRGAGAGSVGGTHRWHNEAAPFRARSMVRSSTLERRYAKIKWL